LPPLVHERLRHLAFDLHTSLADLLVEGAVLLLRFHDKGGSLPEPTPPLPRAAGTSPTEKGAL
jgi:hypothetical protein